MIDEQQIFSSASVLRATFTADSTTDVFTSSAHGFTDGDLVRVSNSGGALPTGLAAATDYYVMTSTTNTFKLSTVRLSGTAVDISTNGTGTQTVALKGKVIQCDGFRHIHLSYDTTGSANMTAKIQMSTQMAMPNFNDAQSVTNRWYYTQVKDLDTGSAINGATGIAPSGTDFHTQYEINVNAAKWVTLDVTAWSAGKANVFIYLSGKYNY